MPLAAIAAVYGAVTFVACDSKEDPPPATPFTGPVFLDSVINPRLGTGHEKFYKYLHNSSSPDGSKMFVVINESDTENGAPNGTFHMFMLDAAQLEQGNVVELAYGSIDGGAGVTTFRSNWNGTKIALAGAGRAYIIDSTSTTLAALGSVAMTNGENHDALPTTDGKYAILALRTPAPRDGILQLYNMNTHALVGNTVSVCARCHARSSTTTVNMAGTACSTCHAGGSDIAMPTAGATLCGLDGVVTRSATAATYSGTIYVAGHGGHFAKLAITIDDSGAEPVIGTPIPVPTSAHGTPGANSLEKLTVTTDKFAASTAGAGTSTRKLHDARLSADGSTIFWSAYNVGADGKAHYGKLPAAGGTVVDIAVDIPTRASWPGSTQDLMPIYCASGQTDTAFFPSTMTNEAYISVFPKADIQ
jgi:hypothetical protein